MAGKGKVLVVDDEPIIIRIVEVNLRMDGYQVLAAREGEEGLRLIERERPDLVVLDVIMPGMDGWTVLERIRARPEIAHTPVILLTGLGQDADVERGMLLGCDVYLTKPFSPQELVTVVNRLVEGMRGASSSR